MKKKKMVIVEIEPGSAHRAPQDTTPHNSHVCVAGFMQFSGPAMQYASIATVGEIRVYRRADFQSGSIVLKKVF